jgi:hypothetical protein
VVNIRRVGEAYSSASWPLLIDCNKSLKVETAVLKWVIARGVNPEHRHCIVLSSFIIRWLCTEQQLDMYSGRPEFILWPMLCGCQLCVGFVYVVMREIRLNSLGLLAWDIVTSCH